MNRYLLAFAACTAGVLLYAQTSYAQLYQKATPPSFHEESIQTKDVPVEQMRWVDAEKLLEEDRAFDTIKDIPWRFGDNIDVNINPDNAGRWDYLSNGDKIWRVAVSSQGAYTLNFTFDRYHLPPGAQLFLYNSDKSMILGAFTDFNNQEDGYFATTLIDGDFVIIEYYEPAHAAFSADLNLEMVTHAYRDPYQYAKGFGDSGSCNLNVACEEADDWQNQVRSAAMLVTGGNGFCSGALINNTEFDGTPLFLSANHCYRNPSTVVFWFNWQSETCSNPNSSPPYNSMSGATQRARNATSDFWLMELNQPVPDEFNPYYAGWNRAMDATLEEFITGVHHPRGDIKKFSYAEDGVQAASYLGNPGSGTSHWRIVWSGGTTTEPGSSGSPIFDDQGRILGQLHGGYAACGNTLPDWYGRIGVSWTGGGSNTTRLSNWLDPNETDIMVLDGYDPFGLVDNPGNFDATNIAVNANLLEWEANEEQDNVMIAVNHTNSFEQPEGPYTVGEELENGEIIIYLGHDEEFLHEDLEPAQTYYYRIWAYNDDLAYSAGLSASAKTPCPEIVQFPFFEGFNEEEISVCWTQQFEEGDAEWLVGEGNNDGYPLSPYEGDYNVFFRVFNLNETGYTTKLISPIMDLSVWESAQLSFYYANPASQSNQDVLTVYYRTQIDEPWQQLDVFDTNEFSWTHVEIDLPGLSSTLQIAFEGEGNRGRGISLDQVEVFVSAGENLPQPANLSVSLTHGNQPLLEWDHWQDKDKDEQHLEGFNIYRNGEKIYSGNDPVQTAYTDGPLPAGSYNYYVTARSNMQAESEPSNEADIDIAQGDDDFTLTLTTLGEGSTHPETGTYSYLPDSEITIEATADTYWQFSHWLVDDEESGTEPTLSLTLNADTDATAVFALNMYEVQLDDDPTGAALTLEGEDTYEHGATATISTQPAVGYVFSQWLENDMIVSTRREMEIAITAHRNFTAQFTEQNYELNLSVTPEEAGTVTGGGTYGAQAEAEIAAIPEPGWEFSHWAMVLEEEEEEEFFADDAVLSFVVTQNLTLVAYFEPFMPTLSIDKEGEGSTQPAAGEYSHSYGDEIELSAQPADEWAFEKWIINEQDIFEDPYTFVIEEHTAATAIFQPVTQAGMAAEEPALQIFPVPASSEVTLILPDNGETFSRVLLINTTGQVVAVKEIATANKNLTFSTEHLTTGVYFIRVEGPGETIHGKMIIE